MDIEKIRILEKLIDTLDTIMLSVWEKRNLGGSTLARVRSRTDAHLRACERLARMETYAMPTMIILACITIAGSLFWGTHHPQYMPLPGIAGGIVAAIELITGINLKSLLGEKKSRLYNEECFEYAELLEQLGCDVRDLDPDKEVPDEPSRLTPEASRARLLQSACKKYEDEIAFESVRNNSIESSNFRQIAIHKAYMESEMRFERIWKGANAFGLTKEGGRQGLFDRVKAIKSKEALLRPS